MTNEGLEAVTDITIVGAPDLVSPTGGETESDGDDSPEILLGVSSGLVCEAGDATVSCGLATLAPGAEAILTIRFDVEAADPLRVNHTVAVSARVPPAQ